jgi:hypothetical protein
MNKETYIKAKEWQAEYSKRPYSVTMKQINDLDILLVTINQPKVRDRTCGVCVKNSVEVLLHQIKKYEEQLTPEEQPKKIIKRKTRNASSPTK